jgi:hypothetical protein
LFKPASRRTCLRGPERTKNRDSALKKSPVAT